MVEVHFHDSEFTLFGKSVEREADETGATGSDSPEESGGSGGAVGALVALVVLVVVAVAVRRALDGEEGAGEKPPADVESGV